MPVDKGNKKHDPSQSKYLTKSTRKIQKRATYSQQLQTDLKCSQVFLSAPHITTPRVTQSLASLGDSPSQNLRHRGANSNYRVIPLQAIVTNSSNSLWVWRSQSTVVLWIDQLVRQSKHQEPTPKLSQEPLTASWSTIVSSTLVCSKIQAISAVIFNHTQQPHTDQLALSDWAVSLHHAIEGELIFNLMMKRRNLVVVQPDRDSDSKLG